MGKTVIFDLGNVLVFFSFPRMIAQMAACTGLLPQEIQHHFFDTPLREQYESGLITTDALYQTFQKASPKQFTKDELLFAISDIFVPNVPVYPLLHALKKKGHQLLLLSNTSEAHFNFLLPRTPILSLFDKYILSYEVGSIKPEAPIYEAALKVAARPPKECFYTDDIPEFIAAAKTLGIDGEVFTGHEALEVQLKSRSLL
jgi:putative hydrolase of the HAD superfamily